VTRLLFLLLLIWTLPGRAGEGETLLAQVRRQFEARALWEFRFQQEVVSPMAADTQRASGVLLACPGGAFRVDVDGLHLLSDGTRLWRWETGGSQVLLEAPGQSPDVLLPHQLLVLLEEKFRVTAVKKVSAERRRLQLAPRSGSESLREAGVLLVKEAGQWWPADVSFTDFSDTRHRFKVTGRRSWPDRSARKAELTFRLPAGMELVDLRQPGATHAP
jgi:hypothetical protein